MRGSCLVVGRIVLGLGVGCATPLPPPAPRPAPEVPVSAAELARGTMRAKVGALLHVERLRAILAASATERLGDWGEIARDLGLDPMRDVRRVFVTSTHALGDRSAIVIDADAAPSFLRAKLAAASGQALVGTPPRATLRLADGTQVTVAIGDLIVAVPSWDESALDAFAAPTRLPDPVGDEAASFFAFDLASTLGTLPRWPSTMVAAQAFITLTPGGGGRIRFDGRSTSPEQARADAEALSAEARRLLTVDLKLFDLELLTPPAFSSEAEAVNMTTTLTPEELGWLLAFTGSR